MFVALLLQACDGAPTAEFVKEIPWALNGSSILMDTHSHTRFSDGALTVAELVDRAALHGCDALAITDHGDHSVRAASPEYFTRIREQREMNPELLLFAGLEWNIPPYGYREHATVLLHPDDEERVLPAFKRQFDDTGDNEPTVDEALRWLQAQLGNNESVAVFYNHPSRKDEDVLENLRDMEKWRSGTGSKILVGFEGAPGHQKEADSVPLEYRGAIETLDRWDPVVAEVGGVWDVLLDRGDDVWGALAPSDFHNDSSSSSCEFAQTYVQVSERTHLGIIEGLRAGSFWAQHGRLLTDLIFLVSSPQLPLPATPGETISIDGDALITLQVAIERGIGGLGEGLTVEIIGNGLSGRPQLLDSITLSQVESRLSWDPGKLTPGADGQSVYFRIRVRKDIEGAADLLAYSNPIRVYLR